MNKFSKPKGRASQVILNLIITIVFGIIYFYLKLPALNLKNPGMYVFVFLLSAVYCGLSIISLGLHRIESGREFWDSLKKNCAAPVIICAALVVLFIVGSFISSPILRARAYSNLLQIAPGSFTDEIEEITYSQIPMLDKDSAQKLGDRKMGELSDMVSQFELSDNYTQINYRGRPVRVSPLEYSDLIKWFNNRSRGLPAYVIIDMVTQKVDVVRLEEGMKYSTNEHFSRNLYRHLRFNYPTFMFEEATFEIDEEGVPYWVCPRLVKRIGLFGGSDIQGAVLVNAITGECTYYEELPSWVDRVYRAELIIEQYDYYGLYKNGWLNSIFGQRGVTVTTDGYNYLALGDDVYMYTGITSVVSDESNVGFILTNQRTKETKYYAIAGAEEYSAMDSAQGVVQHLNYRATFPLLLNISSQPTYFMALKDSADLVKMYAMVNVQQYQIVATGATVSECEANYKEMLARNNLVSQEEITSDKITGVISDIRSAVLEGNTHYYIRLEGGSFYYVISLADSELAAVLNVGDEVIISSASGEGELRRAFSVERAA
ncbi:MAG TPA: CvpA family protein [Clostridiales bacterium]|nr:CvpA family protein [Clostridiales bacterium]